MNIKIPKNDKYQWTQHSIFKMRQYGLSPQRVVRVIRNPERIEEGIVEKTIAVMQPASIRHYSSSRGKPASKKWSQEIWAMYQLRGSGAISKTPHPTLSPLGRGGKGRVHPVKSAIGGPASREFNRVKIISAWRYPGVSPKNNPIPEEILREIKGIV